VAPFGLVTSAVPPQNFSSFLSAKQSLIFGIVLAVVDTGFVKTRFITPQTGVEMLKVR
jgi:hypothetical protein